jgi:hypothetical protein
LGATVRRRAAERLPVTAVPVGVGRTGSVAGGGDPLPVAVVGGRPEAGVDDPGADDPLAGVFGVLKPRCLLVTGLLWGSGRRDDQGSTNQARLERRRSSRRTTTATTNTGAPRGVSRTSVSPNDARPIASG